jgi:hypothetical protein
MYHNADTSNYMRQFVSNVFLSPQDMNPSATDRLVAALKTMQQAASVPLTGPDSFETLGFVISLVGGSAVPGHPEAARTSISRAFRNFAAELVITAGETAAAHCGTQSLESFHTNSQLCYQSLQQI